MISNDVINSRPVTIQNSDNFLRDYVNTSGFQWNSTCLDVAFRNLGSSFNSLVNRIGDYNTVTATNPQFIPPRSWQEKDYSGACPQGWTNRGNNQCINLSYTGRTDCLAGRTRRVPRQARCPPNSQPDTINNGQESFWNWWWPGWGWRQRTIPNFNAYVGWNGPIDASQMNQNSQPNISRQPPGEGTFCTAGWSRANSIGGATQDCRNSGGSWISFLQDPGFARNSYTCYRANTFDNVTEGATNFTGFSNEHKRSWENHCGAFWPMVTRTVPGRWTCTYGTRIEDDIARGNIFNIGSASNPIEAARVALRSNRMVDNFFFIVGTDVFITGGVSPNVNVFISKGLFQPNCTEQNNRRGTLFFISQNFFNMLQECRVVNDSINLVNTNRDILQNAVSSIERFTPINNIKDINDNGNEVAANLVSDFNKKAELYNYQVDLIGQNEKLVEDHNKKLNQQLDDLTAIQDQIALKDRVIELNDELTKKQIRNKKILIGFFVLIPILGIPLLLVVTKAFSPFIGLGIAGLLIVGYIIYMVVVANQNDVKKFGREGKKILSKYESSIANYWNKQKEELSRSLSVFVNGNCATDGTNANIQEEEQSVSNTTKGDYLLKSNGPFYYYDGSAPPQQIHPGAVGSIDFSIDGKTDKNLRFPKEISDNINNIENPITRLFFEIWLSILSKNNININDSRFAQDLDVIDFPDSDQNPPPYWDNIKLPIVSSIQQQFDYLFSSLSQEKRDLSNKVGSNLANIWNFVKGNKIPGDVYDRWVNRLGSVLEEDQPDIKKFYDDFLTDILGSMTKDAFVNSKMIEFIKIINKDINVSQPFVKKYI